MRLSHLAVVLLFLPLASAPVAAEQPPASGDWVVTEDTVVSNETVILDGNLTVMSGARLELYNVSVSFDHPDGKARCVRVEKGAFLKLAGSRMMDEVDITCSYFSVYGQMEVIDSSLSRFQSNIYIMEGISNFTGSDIYSCGYGIWCNNSTTVNIRGCHFNAGHKAVSAYSAVVNLENTTIHGSIVAYNSTLNISGCKFTESPWSFAYVDLVEGSATVRDCLFTTGTGMPPPESPAPSAAPQPPEKGVAVQDCRFSGCNLSCFLGSDYDGSYMYIGLEFHSVERALVWNCTFADMNVGMLSYQTSRASVENCSFEASDGNRYDPRGVDAWTFQKEDCLIRNNTFRMANGLRVRGGSVEDNTFIAYSDTFSESFITCWGPSRVVRNRMTGQTRTTDHWRGTGVSLAAGSASAEVSENTMRYLYCGIDCIWLIDPQPEMTAAVNNTILDCEVGIWVKSEMDVHGNNISARRYGIDGGAGAVKPLLHDNLIGSLDIGMQLKGGFQAFNNSVCGKNVGMLVNYTGDSYPANRTGDASCNTFVSNGTGIGLIDVHLPNQTVSVANNTLMGCYKGIAAERSNASVRDNAIGNITGWGLYSLDSNCSLACNTYTFPAENAAGACREGHFWTVDVDAAYNAAPAGQPEQWTPATDFWLRVLDSRGAVDFNGPVRANRRSAIEECSISSSGTKNDRNPYVLVANLTGNGIASAVVVVTAPCKVTLRLVMGVDLAASLPNVPAEPVFEGDHVSITAAAFNDGTYNPWNVPAADVEMVLAMDGKTLNTSIIPLLGAGGTQNLSAGWVAEAGWHNLTFTIDPEGRIPETRKDNNLIQYSFRVMPVPKGRLGVNGSVFDLWEPVNFTIELFSGAEEASGYRFDFGDGQSSGWLPVPAGSHIYRVPGCYTIRAFIAPRQGPTRECLEAVNITAAFPAWAFNLSADPDLVLSAAPVRLRALMDLGAEDLTSVHWDFGDGESIDGREFAEVTHSYSRPGNYTAVATLSFDGGFSRELNLGILVLNRPPVASGAVSPGSGTVHTLFELDSSSADPDGVVSRWLWDLGDGNRSEAPRTTYTYSRHGTFHVSLSVQDDRGDWSLPVNFTVTIGNLPPIPVLRIDRNVAETGMVLKLDASGTADIDDPPGALSYSWDFGDGSSASGAKATHAYKRTGRFTVTLTVDDGAGGISTKTAAVEVRQATGPEVGWQMPAAVAGALLAVSIIIYIIIRILTHRHEGHGPGAGKLPGKPPRKR